MLQQVLRLLETAQIVMLVTIVLEEQTNSPALLVPTVPLKQETLFNHFALVVLILEIQMLELLVFKAQEGVQHVQLAITVPLVLFTPCLVPLEL